MWPFSEIARLKEENADIKRNNDRLESLQISATDKEELEFLREKIKDYVVYHSKNLGYPGWFNSYHYFADRTLKDAESDLTKTKFYISVLEAQLGKDGTESAHKVCERLKELCNMKAEIKELR